MRICKRILPLILLLSVLLTAIMPAQAGDEPLIVDGTGSELGNTPVPGGDTSSSTPVIEEGSGSEGETADTDDSDDDTADDGDVTWSDEPLYEEKPLAAFWQGVSYPVVDLGTAVTVLKTVGGKVTVPTRDLTFETEEAPGRQLAIINAPKTGQATMHKTTSSKSVILKKCDTGTVVTVLKYGKKRTRILYNGAEGYVLTSALTFCKALETNDYTFAYVAYKGNTKSKNTVKTRMNGSANSRTLGEYPCGTLVTVFSVDEKGKWSEIEIEGVHCWILSEFLTPAEGIVVAAGSAATPTPAPTAEPD